MRCSVILLLAFAAACAPRVNLFTDATAAAELRAEIQRNPNGDVAHGIRQFMNAGPSTPEFRTALEQLFAKPWQQIAEEWKRLALAAR